MNKFNNEPIDIVIPWVNPNDSIWQKDYNYWKEKEIGEKNPCRFRDLETFNYWFRCIEKNCDWFRYIFLILASSSQIPDWLNIDNPKLKIIYHKDFILNDELPTFNSSVINCYIPFIKDISENYILFNDDFFVIEKITEDEYFQNNIPINNFIAIKQFNINGPTAWYKNIKNNNLFTEKYMNANIHFIPSHGPIAFKKSLQQFIWEKFKNNLTSALSNSKFRTNKNYTDWLFFDIQTLYKYTIKSKNSIVQYINIPSFQVKNKVVCFNDNERLTDASFNLFKTNVNKYLNNKFPSKCNYEK